MLSNAYFLAKFRFDTAENEPAKNLQNFANFPNFAILFTDRPGEEGGLPGASGVRRVLFDCLFESWAGRYVGRYTNPRLWMFRFRLHRHLSSSDTKAHVESGASFFQDSASVAASPSQISRCEVY